MYPYSLLDGGPVGAAIRVSQPHDHENPILSDVIRWCILLKCNNFIAIVGRSRQP